MAENQKWRPLSRAVNIEGAHDRQRESEALFVEIRRVFPRESWCGRKGWLPRGDGPRQSAIVAAGRIRRS